VYAVKGVQVTTVYGHFSSCHLKFCPTPSSFYFVLHLAIAREGSELPNLHDLYWIQVTPIIWCGI